MERWWWRGEGGGGKDFRFRLKSENFLLKPDPFSSKWPRKAWNYRQACGEETGLVVGFSLTRLSANLGTESWELSAGGLTGGDVGPPGPSPPPPPPTAAADHVHIPVCVLYGQEGGGEEVGRPGLGPE